MASILKVDEMQGVTSAGSITITSEGGSATMQLQQGLCKAWFEMGSDFALDDSLNIASMTDDGTGLYTYTYTNNTANANYAVSAGPTSGSRNTTFIWVETTSLATSGAAASYGTQSAGTTTLTDGAACMATHGDLA